MSVQQLCVGVRYMRRDAYLEFSLGGLITRCADTPPESHP